MKKIIHSVEAPKAVGPYSQAVIANGLLFVSGQLPIDPVTGEFASSDIEGQTHQVMKNIKAVLDEAGLTLDSVVKSNCFLEDMNNFYLFNSVYGTYFTQDPPARECVEVARLPKDALVEISVICSF